MKKVIIMASAIALTVTAGGALVGCSDDAKTDDAQKTKTTMPAANNNMAKPAPADQNGDAHQ